MPGRSGRAEGTRVGAGGGPAGLAAPITEKGKGRNLKIPDSVFRRLTLEAQRRETDNSKLVTKILDQALPADIRIVVGDEKAPAPE